MVCTNRGRRDFLFLVTLILMALLPFLSFDGICRAAEDDCVLRLDVSDVSGRPLPCRVHLTDERGAPQRVEGHPYWNDHFVCLGQATLNLAPGDYGYTIERGPEFESAAGNVKLLPGNEATATLQLRRIADLRQRGWYAGDLHVHRPVSQIETLMLAEDLDFAPVITWWNRRNLWAQQAIPQQLLKTFDGHRMYDVMAGEDEREGGALLYFRLTRPLEIADATREVPSPLKFVELARTRKPDVWIDLEKPFWWDVPIWLASGQMQSIGLANNHMCRGQMLANEAWGKPREVRRLPNPRGNGYWSQEIYYHILNCGLRIPPSAGSASGVLPNPVGYNRVYVNLDGELTADAWWKGLSQGRCFVTNGPLLLCHANGQLPGAVLKAAPGETLDASLEIELIGRDRVRQVEIIKNGAIERTLACVDQPSQTLAAKLTFSQPGWFLIRAIADNEQTFRFASTGPFYVEIGEDAQHVSRTSVRFFQDWVTERSERVRQNVADQEALEAVLRYHRMAAEFWKQRSAMANTE